MFARLSTLTIVKWLSVVIAVVGLSQFFAADWMMTDGWWCTWIAMAGFVLLSSLLDPIQAGLTGFSVGLASIGTAFWWAQRMLAYSLDQEGIVPASVFVVLVCWEALLFGLIGCAIATIRIRQPQAIGLLLPVGLWIIAETYWPRVFRWTLGHSQQGYLPWVQVADLGGASLISAIVWAGASIPLLGIDSIFAKDPARIRRARWGLAIVVIGIGLAWIYGSIRIRQVDSQSARRESFLVALVQEDPSYREAIIRMRSCVSEIATPVQLLVFPESTIGTHSLELDSIADADRVLDLSFPPHIDLQPLMGLSAPLIVGGRSFRGKVDEGVSKFQTAFVLRSDGQVIYHYHKRCLMPIGEYVPGETLFPKLHQWFQLSDHLEAGTSDSPVQLEGGPRVGILICYEDTMPEVSRRTTLAGAELLVCIINASAFEDVIALRQHLRLAQLRAVENRRCFVRTAGTGISCSIDAAGRLLDQIAADTSGILVAKTALRTDWTWFQILGNWPPWLALTIVCYCYWVGKKPIS